MIRVPRHRDAGCRRRGATRRQAVHEVCVGAYLSAGQRCTGTDRVLVHRAIADRFVDALRTVASELRFGQPEDAGVFAGPSKGVSPELAISMITAGFVAAVIGGFDSLRGALIGGLILGIAETIAAGYVSSAMKNAVSFLLLFVVLLWRPQGLFPEAKLRDV